MLKQGWISINIIIFLRGSLPTNRVIFDMVTLLPKLPCSSVMSSTLHLGFYKVQVALKE